MANLVQTAITEHLKQLVSMLGVGEQAGSLTAPQILGYALSSTLAGFCCGTVLGYKIPAAYKKDLRRPAGRVGARALRDLLRHAEKALGRCAAEEWVFTPNEELNGLTPSEAIRFRELTTGVRRLLAGNPIDEPNPDFGRHESDRHTPVLIQGGRGAS